MKFPLQDLADAIRDGDLTAAAKAYKGLTGQEIPVGVRAAVLQEEGRLADALRFYADPDTWKAAGDSFRPLPCPAAADKGDVARAALGVVKEPPAPDATTPPRVIDPGDHAPDPPPTGRPGRFDANQFRVTHGTPKVGKRPAVLEPFDKSRVNVRAVDAGGPPDPFDVLVTAKVVPTPRAREGATPATVEFACSACRKKHEVYPNEVQDIEGERVWVCPGCASKRVS